MSVVPMHEIVVEPVVAPRGWYIVTLRDCTEPGVEWSTTWESAELAFACADHLKRDYAPALLREIGEAGR